MFTQCLLLQVGGIQIFFISTVEEIFHLYTTVCVSKCIPHCTLPVSDHFDTGLAERECHLRHIDRYQHGLQGASHSLTLLETL